MRRASSQYRSVLTVHRKTWAAGFTLIELLVVFGIIASLITTGFLVSSHAEKKARYLAAPIYRRPVVMTVIVPATPVPVSAEGMEATGVIMTPVYLPRTSTKGINQ